jgi:L-threonylcarbamoyladenylate synthase
VSEPSFTIGKDERDAQGRLRPQDLTRIVGVLKAQGFVLLPSDTAYSVATWLNTARIRDDINQMLKRSDDPISLAFPALELVSQWTEPNRIARRLLERYAPGPITVVCRASRLIPDEIVEEAWRSQNRTIGIRIPDSVEERQVAEEGQTPITTVAVRDPRDDNNGVTSFARARDIVRAGTERIGEPVWCAIEGEIQRDGLTSTVIEVLGEDGNFRLHRKGPIPEDELRAFIARALAEAP